MSSHSRLSETIAEALLAIGAVTLRPDDPFTWTSGTKSPIYCDNRLTMSYPDIRGKVADGFAALVRERFPDAEVIAGTATAGIPHAAWLADRLHLPMIYVRDKAKGHGKRNQIEGFLEEGRKVVVIEDLISTGGSSLKAVQAVREAGGHPLAVLAIFSYQFAEAEQSFADKKLELLTLTNYTTLLDVALKLGKIRQGDLVRLQSWKENPQAYGN